MRESQGLAHRLLDTRNTPRESDLSAGSVDALSADLLPDWYDDWVVIETEAWRQLRLHALEALSGRLTEAGRLADAAGAALAAVNTEPLRETARAALIRVHLAEGNQSEALTEFERYRVLLHAELGLEPTRRLGELVGGLLKA
jgi:DNA-binding SARP family transcriptional activator